MAFGDGLELANGALAFAEHQNVELMAARGNQRISGVGVIAQVSPDMTVNVASGNVVAGGVVVGVSASATFAGIVAGGNVLFSTLQASLSSGQAVFVFIHVDSSGVITNTDGTPAVAGQQLPPDVPEDELVLAMLTLTQGDTTIDNVDIEDWRVNVPKGGYVAGQHTVTGQLNAQGALVVGGVLTAESVLTAEAVVNLTGLNTTIGEGFLARHTTGGVITYRTFAEVASDISSLAIGAVTNIEDTLEANDYLRIKATGVEGRTFAEVLSDIAAAPIADPTFTGELGLEAVNVSETELGLLEGAVEGANKLQIGDVLIQWGEETGFSSGQKVVTFPTAYTSTPIVLTTSGSTSTSTTNATTATVNTVSITAFTIQNRDINDTGAGETDITDSFGLVKWVAIGINTA